MRECVWHSIISFQMLIWSFLCGLLFLAEAVCQLHTLSVGIGMIDIRVWLCSQWLFCWFCGTFLNIIIVFCVQTKEYRFAFCLLVFQNQLWDWRCWCRGVEMFSQHHITLIAHFIRNEWGEEENKQFASSMLALSLWWIAFAALFLLATLANDC